MLKNNITKIVFPIFASLIIDTSILSANEQVKLEIDKIVIPKSDPEWYEPWETDFDFQEKIDEYLDEDSNSKEINFINNLFEQMAKGIHITDKNNTK